MSNVLSDAEILSFKEQAKAYKAEGPAAIGVSIAATVAKRLSDEEFIAMVRGQRPEILPLAPRQLEALNGGFAPLNGGAPVPNTGFPPGVSTVGDLLRRMGILL